jgi:hypothetical protein
LQVSRARGQLREALGVSIDQGAVEVTLDAYGHAVAEWAATEVCLVVKVALQQRKQGFRG